jgi:transposase-like protein
MNDARLVIACVSTAATWLAVLILVAYIITSALAKFEPQATFVWALLILLTAATVLRFALASVIRCPKCGSYPLASTLRTSLPRGSQKFAYVYPYAFVVVDVLLRGRFVCPDCGTTFSVTRHS